MDASAFASPWKRSANRAIGMSGELCELVPDPVDSITKFPRMCSDSGPFSSTPSRGRKSCLPGATTTTGPVSALGTKGEVALADPTIVFAGQVVASTSNRSNGQLVVSRAVLAPTPGGSRTFADARPASVASCSMIVVSGVLDPGLVAPGAPTLHGEGWRERQRAAVGRRERRRRPMDRMTPVGDGIELERLRGARGRVAHEALPVDGAFEAQIERRDVRLQAVRGPRKVVHDRVQPEVAATKLDRGLLDDLRQRATDRGSRDRVQDDSEAGGFPLMRHQVVERAVDGEGTSTMPGTATTFTFATTLPTWLLAGQLSALSWVPCRAGPPSGSRRGRAGGAPSGP